MCYEPQGVVQGNQPHGEMTIEFDRFQGVPGFEGTIHAALRALQMHVLVPQLARQLE